MFKFDASEYRQQKPFIQLAPLVDIAFWALIFFMVIAVYNQMETQINISVPKTTVSSQGTSGGKIIINITKDGRFVVNRQQLNPAGLEMMLKKVSKLFPNQQVILRADELAYHKYVVAALDACMRADIWDVSFATVPTENEK